MIKGIREALPYLAVQLDRRCRPRGKTVPMSRGRGILKISRFEAGHALRLEYEEDDAQKLARRLRRGTEGTSMGRLQ